MKVDECSPVPIYLQVVAEIRRGILTGVFGSDQRLPSIRDLAIELKVNPNTIAKAYQEMETLGMIYFKRGQGAYVTPKTEAERMNEAKEEIEKLFQQVLSISKSMGLSQSRVLSMFQEMISRNLADENRQKENRQ